MKILFITYYFPPDTAVGGQRIAKFCKYLPEYGWDASVLTVKDSYRARIDMAGMEDVREISTIKSIELPSIRNTYLRIKGLFTDISVNGGIPYLPGVSSGPSEDEPLLSMIKRYFISLFILLPDEKRNWIIPATLKAVSTIKRHKIDCIMTSCPPHSAHLVGLLVKKLTGVKWIADFRDPWTDVIDFKPPEIRSELSDRIEGWMERSVIGKADRVVTTTGALSRRFKKRFPKEEDKILTIPNGIYTELFDAFRDEKKYDRFTISYTGTLYAGRSPEPVFKAVKELVSSGRVAHGDICIKLVGDCASIDGISTEKIVKSYGLESVVELTGQIPYREALKIMRRSHLLLLLAPNLPLQIPAKVYDYFGSGTRILAISESISATHELIEATGSGGCFESGETKAIGEFFLQAMKERKAGGHGTGSNASGKNFMESLDIKALTGRLAGELTTITSSGLFNGGTN